MPDRAMRNAFAAAFEEWQRRVEHEPEKFADDYGTPERYGQGAADYFVKVLNELADGRPWDTIAREQPNA